MNGFFKANRNQDALDLIRENPLAFTLAYIIAHRARWRDGFNPHHLEIGEALLGDYENYGMTEQQYRTAKAQLERWEFATFRPTNKGTAGMLINARLFSIVGSHGNEQNHTEPTPSQRAANDKRRTKSEEQKSKYVESNKNSLASMKMIPAGHQLTELMDQCREVFGGGEMSKTNCHQLWFKRASEHPSKLRRVLADTRAAAKSGEIKTTPAQYAQHRWKEFAP